MGMTKDEMIGLEHGAGGKSMHELIDEIRGDLEILAPWRGERKDSAYIKDGDRYLVFTTDSYTVSPIFFKGGDIGKLSVTGTLNDLAVMGADPLAISLSFIIEEGFLREKLERIVESVNVESKKAGTPIVTGDLKVMERGEVDEIVINTAGLGTAEEVLNREVEEGDKIVVSGPLGDHEASLLAYRFDYETELESDCSSILESMRSVRDHIKVARDPTRGGLAGILNEFSRELDAEILVREEDVPFRQEIEAITDVLGLDPFHLACEGRFICVTSPESSDEVLDTLKDFDEDAAEIGEILRTGARKVWMETQMGAKKRLRSEDPSSNPRIC